MIGLLRLLLASHLHSKSDDACLLRQGKGRLLGRAVLLHAIVSDWRRPEVIASHFERFQVWRFCPVIRMVIEFFSTATISNQSLFAG